MEIIVRLGGWRLDFSVGREEAEDTVVSTGVDTERADDGYGFGMPVEVDLGRRS